MKENAWQLVHNIIKLAVKPYMNNKIILRKMLHYCLLYLAVISNFFVFILVKSVPKCQPIKNIVFAFEFFNCKDFHCVTWKNSGGKTYKMKSFRMFEFNSNLAVWFAWIWNGSFQINIMWNVFLTSILNVFLPTICDRELCKLRRQF